MLATSHQRDPAGPAGYATPSGWNALLPARKGKALRADAVVDLAVVGAGYTGLAAARRWAELRPDDRVMVLDALPLGEGNPGRNSGFLLEVALAEDADPGSLARMQAANGLIRETLAEMAALVRTSPEPCELNRTGVYRAAAGPAGAAALLKYRRFLDAAGLPYAVLDREALAARIGSRFYETGLYSPDCYLAQPASLIRALAATLPAPVQVRERSPVQRLVREQDGWVLEAAGHRVRARRVMLANNAFAARLWPRASRLVAMYTYAGLTEPLTKGDLAALGSAPAWGLLPAHRLGSTLRLTRDGRLLVRAFHGYESEAAPEAMAPALRDNLARRFPAIRIPRFVATWSGAVGYTFGGGPLWGALDEGLWVSAGCNGGGVVKGTLFGRALAELACGASPPDIAGLFGRARWLPPEPFRRLGYAAGNHWLTRQGAAEL